MPPSCPQEPTSPLLPGDLVLRCGIHVSHKVPSAHSPTTPPYSFLPFSEPSLSAPPTAILQMSPILNTLNPTQTQALHANPIRSLSWIHPGPSPSRSRLAGSLPLARPGNHGCLPHGPPRPPHPFLSSSRKWWSSSETPFRRCPDPSLVPPRKRPTLAGCQTVR